jgi:ankyrin repeat protein
MQKVSLCLVIIAASLALAGCAQTDAVKPRPEAAQQLLKLRGYEFDEKSFFAAAQARDLQAINMFLDAGINPNAQNNDGRTVLIAAAARGDLEVVNVLLARGVDPNVKTSAATPR